MSLVKNDAKKLICELRGSQVPLTSHEAVVLQIADQQIRWVGFISERYMEVLERALRNSLDDFGTTA